MERTPDDEVTRLLSDLYAVEQQALAQLKQAPDQAGHPVFAEHLRRHLQETERHAQVVRQQLEARGAVPSASKDAIMRLGGKGFLLFAQVQPETPGRLAAHAYAYEAMEWAGYSLLRNMAERIDDMTVAAMAMEIAAEERSMMHRIEDDFAGVEAVSHEGEDEEGLRRLLPRHLAEAHALEQQTGQLVRSHILDEEPALDRAYGEHQALSEVHAERLEHRLGDLGSSSSNFKDVALASFGFNWRLFFNSQSDKPTKLSAFIYALAHLQIAGHELLRCTAERAGDESTAALCRENIIEKRRAAEQLSNAFGSAVALIFH